MPALPTIHNGLDLKQTFLYHLQITHNSTCSPQSIPCITDFPDDLSITDS